jgi:GTP-binding protein EngB required for normal cell division
LHIGVRQLCSHLITDTRSNTEIEQYEKFVASTTDTSNPFHLIFEKYDKITATQKEVICGILDLDYNEGRCWINRVYYMCLYNLKNDVTKQVLMEFLKKI